MKKTSLIVLTAAALFAAGIAGAAEQAAQPAAKPATAKTDPAVQTCKDQGKTGKALSQCIREEHKKEREAQHASAAPSGDAAPIK
jgi:hypothetical protein